MKNLIILLCLVVVSSVGKAQNGIKLDTIFANEQKNVALFFPNTIRQGVTGSEDFVFTFNREKQQYFGLLQARPGKESNLLVINTNGSIFSYIVKYKEKLEKLNYFVSPSESIGFEQPKFIADIDNKNAGNVFTDKAFYYERFCTYLVTRKQKIGNIQKRNKGVVLRLENLVFDKDELYFVIDVENKSTLDYDLNFLEISTETRKKGKKKSVQRIFQTPNYKFEVPKRIGEKETKRLVYVLPKFSIDDDKRIIVELNEESGERNLKLKVSSKYINNPN